MKVKLFAVFLILELILPSNSNLTYKKDAAFFNIGSYAGTDAYGQHFSKEYLIPRFYKTQHIHARGLCRSYDMEFAHFATLTEFYQVSNMIKINQASFGGNIHVLVDGLTTNLRSITEWYYTVNDQKIPFEIPFDVGEPNNNNNVGENCMELRNSGDSFLPYRFNDIPCSAATTTGFWHVLCQRDIL